MQVSCKSTNMNKPQKMAGLRRLCSGLQTRVPRVRVLLPLPSKKPTKTAEMRGFWGLFISFFDRSFSVKMGQKRGVNLKNASQMQVKNTVRFFSQNFCLFIQISFHSSGFKFSSGIFIIRYIKPLLSFSPKRMSL